MFIFFSVLWAALYWFAGYYFMQNAALPLFWVIVFYPVSIVTSLIGFKIGAAIQNFFYNEMNVVFFLARCPAAVGFIIGAAVPPMLFLMSRGII